MEHVDHILIVDDDRAVVDTFARMLKLEGFNVATAISPESRTGSSRATAAVTADSARSGSELSASAPPRAGSPSCTRGRESLSPCLRLPAP